MFTAAGLTSRPVVDDETLVISLPSMTTEHVVAMVSVMRQSMRRPFATVDLLNAAGQEHSLLFHARVVRHRVEVADLTIYEADQLATLLGSSSPAGVDLDDLDDSQTAEAVADRLQRAIETATGDQVALDLLPACFCSSCRHSAAVRFPPMGMRTAKRLGRRLNALGTVAGRTPTEGTVC